jgi:hypothetical protein
VLDARASWCKRRANKKTANKKQLTLFAIYASLRRRVRTE